MSLQVFHHLHPQVCKHCGEFLLRAHQCVTPAEQRGNQHRSYSWYHACSWEYQCMQSVTHNNAGGEYSLGENTRMHTFGNDKINNETSHWHPIRAMPQRLITSSDGLTGVRQNKKKRIRQKWNKNKKYMSVSVSQINLEQCFLFWRPSAGQTFVIASNTFQHFLFLSRPHF